MAPGYAVLLVCYRLRSFAFWLRTFADAFAAFFAICLRSSAVRRFARASAPFRPISDKYFETGSCSIRQKC